MCQPQQEVARAPKRQQQNLKRTKLYCHLPRGVLRAGNSNASELSGVGNMTVKDLE